MNILDIFKLKSKKHIRDFYRQAPITQVPIWWTRPIEDDIARNAAIILAGIISAVPPCDLTEIGMKNAITAAWETALELDKLKKDYLNSDY